MPFPKRKLLASQVALALAAATLASPDSLARITRIEIASTTPAYNGVSIGSVGPYERIVGKAFGELDPSSSSNSIIVDLGLAPKNSRGMVEYSFDFYILKPVDLSKGNRKVM